jgi:ATP-binding cassette subfamily C exporter for protease/lipase
MSMKKNSSTWGQLISLIRNLHRELLLVGLLSMAINLLMLSPSLYMLQVYDRVMVSLNEMTLLFSTLLLCLVVTIVAWLEYLRTGLLVGIGVTLDQELQPHIFYQSLNLELNSPSANPIQPLFDLAQVRQFITGHGIFVFFDAPWFFIYAGVLYLLHPILGMMGFFFAVIHIGFFLQSQKYAVPLIDASTKSQIQSQSVLQSQLRNVESARVMGMLPALKRVWRPVYDQWSKDQSVAEIDGHKRSSVSKIVRYLQQSLSLGGGAILVIHGEISIGSMIASNILITRMLQPLDAMTGSWRSWLGVQGALQRIQSMNERTKFLKYEPRMTDFNSSAPLVRAQSLSADLGNPRQRVLDDVDLTLPVGSITALVGPSGAGKSSLALALLGLLPETRGLVFWDNQQVQHPSMSTGRKGIGYLPQKIDFVNGTVAQNICRFSDPSSEAVIKAASLIGAHEMILSLVAGYDTVIGPQGIPISSGQKQRIGLARAIYGDPKFVVLDEPDSHLDEPGELALAKAVLRLKEMGCTIVLISHKKNLLSNCDRIVFMESGHILREVSVDQVSI